MKGYWGQVTESEFDAELLRRGVVDIHVVTICDPPVKFYWDAAGAAHADRSFGQHAFAKCVMDYEVKDKNTHIDKSSFFIWKEDL